MDSGDYAWMLISTALVVFMIPGLALFYGGMTRSKNVLNMFMMNMYCVGIVPIVWVLLGYSLGNSPDGSGFFGGEWLQRLRSLSYLPLAHLENGRQRDRAIFCPWSYRLEDRTFP